MRTYRAIAVPDEKLAEVYEKISAAIVRHQQLEIEYDRTGDYRHSLDENHTVSALISLRDECGF